MTLVELLIVVTIIAVIAAVAMAVYQDIVKKSRLAADQGVVSSFAPPWRSTMAARMGCSPASLAIVEGLVTPPPVYKCSVVPSYDASNGKITYAATLGDCS